MELAEFIGLRPVPGAGLLVTLTRRCPLSCAHCSTTSSLDSDEAPTEEDLLRFVGSFTPEDRPDVVLLTGGEPLLLPALVHDLAVRARAAGARSVLLSGMFFAGNGRIPPALLRVIGTVDHFSASLDEHHEREVPRRGVLRAMKQVFDMGIPVSFHLTGSGPDDPYLADVTAEIRREFADRVPMLVNELRAVGRAASWASASVARPDAERAMPCAMAAWPTVAFDGSVLACCNQHAVDARPVPPHLLLGHIARDDWPTVRRRTLTSPMLRMIRTIGPAHLRNRYASDASGSGYCAGCRELSSQPDVLDGVRRDASGPVGELLDLQSTRMQTEAGPAALVRRYGCPPYADLVALGRRP